MISDFSEWIDDEQISNSAGRMIERIGKKNKGDNYNRNWRDENSPRPKKQKRKRVRAIWKR